MRKVNYQRAHMSRLIQKIDSREQMLRSRVDFLKTRDEETRAKMYLKEMGEIVLIKRVLKLINLGLTAVSERLDTMKILFKALSGFRPVAKTVDEAIQHSSFLPMDFKDVMNDLAGSYSELLEILHPPDAQIFFDIGTPEAQKIINQVEKELEKEVISQYPKVPLDTNLKGGNLAEKMEEVITMLLADGGTETTFTKKKRKMSFEDKVLYYMNMKGNIDVFGCARQMKTSPQKVIGALYELAEDGKLKFNG